MKNRVSILLSTIPKNRVYGREFYSIVEFGKSLFGNTALIEEDISFCEDDIRKVIAFWIEVSPPKKECQKNGINWYGIDGSLQHFIIASQVAKHLATKVCESNPDFGTQISPIQMSVVGLLHDLGRSKTHQFYATDALSELFMEEMGISPKIRNSLHKIEWYWEIDKALELETISIAQLISVLADTLSKRSNDQKRLRRTHEVVESVKKGKNKYFQLPIETDLDQLVRERILQHAIKFMEDLGKNIDQILEGLDWMVNLSGEELINMI
jgi:hypothetical protein